MPSEATRRPSIPEPSRSNAEHNDDPEFEREAERAEEEEILEKELKDTFPTSDPPSSWAGKDHDSA
jgi:hypothetical protein